MSLSRPLRVCSAYRLSRAARKGSALLLAVLLLAQCAVGLAVPSVALGATPTITWTTQADFEANVSTTGEVTTRLNADTTSSPGDVMIGGPALTIASGEYHVIGVRADGSAMATGGEFASFGAEKNEVDAWTDLLSAEGGYDHTVGLRSDGTVVLTETYGEQDVSAWTGITDIAAGWAFTVGVESGGGVVGTGNSSQGQLGVAGWADIKSVDAGRAFTLGLTGSGDVVAAGENDYGQLNVGAWSGITAVAAGAYHSVGLTADHKVVAVGSDSNGQVSGVAGWENIIAIAASGRHTVGLRENGTVVAVGENLNGALDVSGWTGIVAISTGWDHTLGIKVDGTVVAAGPDDIVGEIPQVFRGELGLIGGPDYHFDYGLNADIGLDGVLEELDADFDALRAGEAVKFAVRVYDGVTWTPLLGVGGQPIDWTSGTGNYFGQAFGDVAMRGDLSALPDGWFVEIVVRLEGTAGTSPVLHSVTLNPTEEPPITHMVTFVDWDGTVLKTQVVEHGSGATAPANPPRAGYTFTGWSPSDFSNVTTDLTVTAQYLINTYTVTFNANGGAPVPGNQSVQHGGLVTQPPAPAKSGVTFVGWYSDAGLTDAWDFATDTVTGNLTLYAKYAINTYTVTFVDWNSAVLKTQQVEHGNGATAPANPTRTGYTFTGWSPANFSNITGNLTVTAMYSPLPTGVEFVRWGGYDRYETAVLGAYGTYPEGTDVAIIAVGTNYPDALAASSLAGITDAPILLTRTETLHPHAKLALTRLGVSKVYIMGSVRAVSAAVETEIRKISGITSVVRLGGPTRYETARFIADEVLRLGGSASEIFLTRGDDFPDALSVSSTAAQRHMPILLTKGSSLEANAALFIRTEHPATVYIAGGENVVPRAAADGAKAAGATTVTRWAGANRYETSAAVIKNARAKWGITAVQFGIATGQKFPDALTGGALMGRLRGVLVLNRPDILSATTRELLVTYKPEIRRVVFFGSTLAISQEAEDAVRAVFK